MTAAHTEDGYLPAALTALGDAIHSFTEPRCEVFDGNQYWTDSLLDQLRDALPGDQGSGHGVPRSLPPLFVDAADLLNEIDTAVRCWEPRCPGYDGDLSNEPTHPTVLRLRHIERNGCRGQGWRPMDTSKIEQLTANINEWTAAIRTLLNPQPSWSLPNACPACNTAIVYRKDASGDQVRKPALSIGASGCTCLNCRHTWGPQLFQHLANVLGYPLTPGILE